MAANIGRYYEALHQLNCRKELGEKISIKEHKRAIWMALHASYALEAFRFMVSFATSLAMVEIKFILVTATLLALSYKTSCCMQNGLLG